VLDLKGRVEQSGLTLEKLAKRTGLSIVRLEQIMQGAEAKLGEIRKLASALKMSIADLVVKTPIEKRAEFLFRQKMHKAEGEESLVVSRLSRFISHSFDFLPAENVAPSWLRSFGVQKVNYNEAENLARIFRDRFYDGDQVGPLLALPKIAAEKLNILLLVVPEQDVDGASAVISGHVFVFVSPRFPGRMLFTLAHEIGHCVAHHNADSEYAIFDGADQVGKLKKAVKDQESFADTFASCVLMPAGGVAVALRKIREATKTSVDGPVGDIHILYLSRIFGVSFEVAARRCEQLELLPSGGAYSLYKKLKDEFGSPEKRAAAVGLPPRPQIEFPRVPLQLLTAAIERVKRGEMSVGRASNYLSLSVADLLKAHAATIQ
jgi:transcriptional regulator with XRE-family HTH domain